MISSCLAGVTGGKVVSFMHLGPEQKDCVGGNAQSVVELVSLRHPWVLFRMPPGLKYRREIQRQTFSGHERLIS